MPYKAISQVLSRRWYCEQCEPLHKSVAEVSSLADFVAPFAIVLLITTLCTFGGSATLGTYYQPSNLSALFCFFLFFGGGGGIIPQMELYAIMPYLSRSLIDLCSGLNKQNIRCLSFERDGRKKVGKNLFCFPNQFHQTVK